MLPRPEKPSAEKCKDSGLALVLLSLIGYRALEIPALFPASVIFLLLAMGCPRIFRPFATLWFGLSAALGAVVSRVILASLFFGLVLPVGLVRRALGKDPMQTRKWHRGKESVFRVRSHRFVAEDLDHPY